MGLFQSLQDLIGDATGGLGELPGVQEIQDIAGGATEAATSATDGITEAIGSVTEQGQAAVDDITQKIGV